jgi:RNA polymerase sigma factor (sigma-70 family)
MGLSCDDIEQEARISLWKALKSEREIASPVSYVYRVAVSVTLRAIRRAKARREEALVEEPEAVQPLCPPPAVSPYTAAVMRECRQTVSAALARLAKNRRLAVELHLQGLTTREIGDILAWTEPKARNLVHRGLKDLRSSLRDMGIEHAW